MQPIKSSGTGVAGNVTTSITADSRQRCVLYGQVVLTTDATVANRRVVFRITDKEGDTVFDSHSGAVVAASQSNQHHEFMPGIFRETSFIGDALQVPIPMRCLLPVGYTLQIIVENGVAGDSYDYSILAEYVPSAKGVGSPAP